MVVKFDATSFSALMLSLAWLAVFLKRSAIFCHKSSRPSILYSWATKTPNRQPKARKSTAVKKNWQNPIVLNFAFYCN